MLLGFADHALNVRLGEAPRGLNADLLLLAGSLVLGRNVHNAIGVDVEGDVDLRHSTRRRRNADQIELTQQLIIGSQLAFALEDADRDRRLVVFGGREDLAALGGDRRVAIDQFGHDAAQCLYAERQRSHIEQ